MELGGGKSPISPGITTHDMALDCCSCVGPSTSFLDLPNDDLEQLQFPELAVVPVEAEHNRCKIHTIATPVIDDSRDLITFALPAPPLSSASLSPEQPKRWDSSEVGLLNLEPRSQKPGRQDSQQHDPVETPSTAPAAQPGPCPPLLIDAGTESSCPVLPSELLNSVHCQEASVDLPHSSILLHESTEPLPSLPQRPEESQESIKEFFPPEQHSVTEHHIDFDDFLSRSRPLANFDRHQTPHNSEVSMPLCILRVFGELENQSSDIEADITGNSPRMISRSAACVNADNLEKTSLPNRELLEPSELALSPLNVMGPKSLEPPLIPLLPNLSAEDWDRFVVSSATDNNTSRIFKALETAGVPLPLVDLCAYFLEMFRDLEKYRQFLSYRNESAQYLLDVLQALLDHRQLSAQFRLILFVALYRLTKKSGLYPQCFNLIDVTLDGDAVARGSFGEVHRGSFRDQVVCVKILRTYDPYDQTVCTAFYREAVVWGQLSDPNIVPFLGICQLGDAPQRIGLVSPWMEKGDLDEYLSDYPDSDHSLLILDVGSGMRYLHHSGVIHGDMKPPNILVDGNGKAALADFGLSSVRDGLGLHSSSLSSGVPGNGTIRYLAPECFNPDAKPQKSPARDVFAFGLICYFIFSGNHPFPDLRENNKILVKLARGDRPAFPTDSTSRRRGLTPPMWRLMEDCWEHDPTYRPHATQIVERLSHQRRTLQNVTAGEG